MAAKKTTEPKEQAEKILGPAEYVLERNFGIIHNGQHLFWPAGSVIRNEADRVFLIRHGAHLTENC